MWEPKECNWLPNFCRKVRILVEGYHKRGTVYTLLHISHSWLRFKCHRLVGTDNITVGGLRFQSSCHLYHGYFPPSNESRLSNSPSHLLIMPVTYPVDPGFCRVMGFLRKPQKLVSTGILRELIHLHSDLKRSPSHLPTSTSLLTNFRLASN